MMSKINLNSMKWKCQYLVKIDLSWKTVRRHLCLYALKKEFGCVFIIEKSMFLWVWSTIIGLRRMVSYYLWGVTTVFHIGWTNINSTNSKVFLFHKLAKSCYFWLYTAIFMGIDGIPLWFWSVFPNDKWMLSFFPYDCFWPHICLFEIVHVLVT